MSKKANVAEARFLSLLRYSALGGAAIALLVSAVLLGIGLARQIGQTEVEPAKVTVAAADVVPLKRKSEKETLPDAPKLTLPKTIRERTALVYRKDFASYERSDTKISEEQVVGLVWTEDRIALFEDLGNSGIVDANGGALFGKEAVMADALDTISEATRAKAYTEQLVGYRDAKKTNVCRDEPRTRSRTVQGWNSYSTSCRLWWESPVGCPTTRVISEPYFERVCEMKYPEELKAPAGLFAASIQQYADVAEVELEAAQIAADEETAENHRRKLKGQTNIGMSGKLFLCFLAVMFLYLFIAMERHNRNLRALMSKDEV